MSKKLTIEEVKVRVKQLNPKIKCLSNIYEGNKTELEFQCENGHIFTKRYDHFISSPKCKICSMKQLGEGKMKKHSIFIKEVFDLVGDEYTVLSEYNGAFKDISIIHNECGNIYEVKPHDFLNDKRCPRCKKWKGEQRIIEILDSLNIQYSTQYSFDNLKGRGNGLLRFDFVIFKNRTLHCLIEYDGEFHYKKGRFKNESYASEKLLQQQCNDKIKNDYCLVNNINLIRIPYWEFDNIESILREELEGVE